MHKTVNPRKKVLLVEDDNDINDAFYMLLTKGGYDVRQTYNGQEALENIPTFEPEIILLDLLMPTMDGNAFLKAFKNEKHIPVIVFSNVDSQREVNEALEHGATRYMLKAWATPDELFRVINDTV